MVVRLGPEKLENRIDGKNVMLGVHDAKTVTRRQEGFENRISGNGLRFVKECKDSRFAGEDGRPLEVLGSHGMMEPVDHNDSRVDPLIV